MGRRQINGRQYVRQREQESKSLVLGRGGGVRDEALERWWDFILRSGGSY
jgi:hypothetical protein